MPGGSVGLEGGQRCDFRVGFSRHDAVEAIPAIPFLADEVEPVLLQELDLVRPQQGSVDGLPRLSRERQLLGIEGLGGPAGKRPANANSAAAKRAGSSNRPVGLWNDIRGARKLFWACW